MRAGAAGQALGSQQAGFDYWALIEIDEEACKTLRFNRPHWNVIRGDLNEFDARPYSNVAGVGGRASLPADSPRPEEWLGSQDQCELLSAPLCGSSSR